MYQVRRQKPHLSLALDILLVHINYLQSWAKLPISFSLKIWKCFGTLHLDLSKKNFPVFWVHWWNNIFIMQLNFEWEKCPNIPVVAIANIPKCEHLLGFKKEWGRLKTPNIALMMTWTKWRVWIYPLITYTLIQVPKHKYKEYYRDMLFISYVISTASLCVGNKVYVFNPLHLGSGILR